VTKSKVIFVEDDFAKDLCEEILRQLASGSMAQIEVHKAGGYPYVVDVMRHHNENPTITTMAIAVIDGDNPNEFDDDGHVVRLPNETPEELVFGWIRDHAKSTSALIQQRCQCPAVSQDKIVKCIEKVAVDTTDHHLYFSKLGEVLGFLSEIVVRRGLSSIYVENNKDVLKPIVDRIRETLSID